MLASTTLPNRVGTRLAENDCVHAITDVTGFGLAGHALEMARGSNLALTIRADDLPLFREAVALVRDGVVTGASGRNWASCGDNVILPADFPEWRRNLLTDPQTSGGLLVACAPECAEAILQSILDAGYPKAPGPLSLFACQLPDAPALNYAEAATAV